MKKLITVFCILIFLKANAQQDTLLHKLSAAYVPIALLSYGSIATYTDWGQNINQNIYSSISKSAIPPRLADALASSPAAAVYALHLLGVQGEHAFWDRSVIIGSSYLVLIPTVYGIKKWTGIPRPNGLVNNSFPSGHTAVAFAGAEFLRREYKNKNGWIGVAGYGIATTVAVLRIKSDNHWFSDVAAGAGLGILSTQFAYWVYPRIKQNLLKNKANKTTVLWAPTYIQNSFGAKLHITF